MGAQVQHEKVSGMRSELELIGEIGSRLGCTSSCCGKNTLVLSLTTLFILFFAVVRCVKLITVLLGSDFNVLFNLPYKYHGARGAAENVPYCCVCLHEAQQGERLRRLPRCNHCFHVDCIDAWFQYRSTCPLCRNEVSTRLHRPHNQLLSFLLHGFRKIHH